MIWDLIRGSLLLVVIYLVVSNTLWLFIGSAFIQRMPGVNIKGFSGTLQIACMILCVMLAALVWLITLIYCTVSRNRMRVGFSDFSSRYISFMSKRMPF